VHANRYYIKKFLEHLEIILDNNKLMPKN